MQILILHPEEILRPETGSKSFPPGRDANLFSQVWSLEGKGVYLDVFARETSFEKMDNNSNIRVTDSNRFKIFT